MFGQTQGSEVVGRRNGSLKDLGFCPSPQAGYRLPAVSRDHLGSNFPLLQKHE